MLEAILGGLTWLLGGFLFWVVLIALSFCTFSTVRGRSYWWASLWVGVLLFCVAFRVTDFGNYIIENPFMMVAWFAGYLAIGVVVSVGKWVYVVKESKQDLQSYREDYEAYKKRHAEYTQLVEGEKLERFETQDQHYEYNRKIANANDWLSVNGDHESFINYFRTLNSRTFKIRELRGEDVIVLNTDKQPIPEWVMFWPITLLTYVFEPVWSLVERIVSHLGHLYDTISAKMLSA
jgi:hypothetical protein